ncbi:glycosyltransferase [Halocalculus aciditolerans]|uniref:Glycosyltransferase 2-like domain-containing protein n=1 Tax=Halocalculus aciditolerans TaxID=1383812 RepID=A0A830FPQ9_9EURY|nr:glycosyltransferase family A protein [Halocalculus aciditolerans]GGL68242.1 hypothetical protein GCM10009039_27830 [Halocalculus aciditolerans]
MEITSIDPEYSITVCCLDMENTVRESLLSILNQVDNRFEIIVVDGGSVDSTTTILSELEENYQQIRVVYLNRNPSRRLGEDRNIAVQHAKGEHILLQLDADDCYYAGILDFVTIYEKIRDSVCEDVYLKGNNLNVSSKDLLLRYGPYRNLQRGEDRDLWRRLFEQNQLIWLEHDPVCVSIGYDPGFMQKIRNGISQKITDFQVGISLMSWIRWSLSHYSVSRVLWEVLSSIYAKVLSLPREKYSTPNDYSSKGDLNARIDAESVTLTDIEERHCIAVDGLRHPYLFR